MDISQFKRTTNSVNANIAALQTQTESLDHIGDITNNVIRFLDAQYLPNGHRL